MAARLGCIADDFTGGADLAGMLVKGGMRTVLLVDLRDDLVLPDVDAIVIALKSRTIPADQAIWQSLQALRYLQHAGCRQFYFKYCSTFDSTSAGNIGPVTEALMQALGIEFTIACPAFPTNGRSVYKGYLFVGDVLLSESGMRDHPLTPMMDANLPRVLQAQSRGRVGLIRWADVAQGPDAVRSALAALRKDGYQLAITDALTDSDLTALGQACDQMPLVTGASGMAWGLADAYRQRGLLPGAQDAARLPTTGGRRAIIAGSCSVATRRQVDVALPHVPSFRIDVPRLMRGADITLEALDWVARQPHDGPVLIYSSSSPEEVRAIQQRSGIAQSGARIEETLARLAQGLVILGVRQLIVAGGETSGAIVQALGVAGLRIGPDIDPGVPWTVAIRPQGGAPLAFSLKSGNFGSDDFFLKAWGNVP
jgi:uncharacterized protein YgbK (DUF1537 family)